MMQQTVAVIGGGVTGLSAALALAREEIQVELYEKAPFLGGKAIHYACKATTACVKCGACLAEQLLGEAVAHPHIHPHLNTTLTRATRTNGPNLTLTLATRPTYIDPDRCNACGICLENCPAPGALFRGTSAHHHPPIGLNEGLCLYQLDKTCLKCQELCPENAIDLTAPPASETVEVDAVIAAHGFQIYDPSEKPYGYARYPDVITNLELEQMLRTQGRVRRPSNSTPPATVGFIQCVGSRDLQRNHVWCSKVCCASTLRMAQLIRHRQPEIDITVFYIDIQTFGKDFERVYTQLKSQLNFVRSIPGEIVATDGDKLQVTYFDNRSQESVDAAFDMIVLATGMHPNPDGVQAAQILALPLATNGFCAPHAQTADDISNRVFAAGAAMGPMSIAESLASGRNAAWQVLNQIERRTKP